MSEPTKRTWVRRTTGIMYSLAALLLVVSIVLLVMYAVGQAQARAPRARLRIELVGQSWPLQTESISYTIRNTGRVALQIAAPVLERYDSDTQVWEAIPPADSGVEQLTLAVGASEQRGIELAAYAHTFREGKYRLSVKAGDTEPVSATFQLYDPGASTVPYTLTTTDSWTGHAVNTGFFLSVPHPVSLSDDVLPLEIQNLREIAVCRGTFQLYRLIESTGEYEAVPYQGDTDPETIDLQLMVQETYSIPIPLSRWDLPYANAFYKIELIDGDGSVVDQATFEIMAD